MRLALVTRRYPPECCGVGDYTARLAQTWARQGHEVVVFVASKEERPASGRPGSGVRVVRMKLDGWGDVRGAVAAIRAERPDAVQLEYSSYGWSRWGCAFWMNKFVRELRGGGQARGRSMLRPYREKSDRDENNRLPVTVALHEFALDFGHALRLAPIALIQRVHFALLVRDASSVVTNTRERVRRLRRWFPWRRETIRYRPNSSHVAVAAASAEEIASLRAEHAEAGAFVTVTFGTYHSNKNFEAVIEAASELRRERPVALWLLGDTSVTPAAYLERLRGKIREHGMDDAVWWSGRMESTEISKCLQAADVFVLPQADGHLTRSSTFMSAAEHGMAVIAVRNDENQTEFAHGENVWLVEKSRPGMIAQAMRELAEDTAMRTRLGGNLRAVYEREFAWEVVAQAPIKDYPQITQMQNKTLNVERWKVE